jgi:RND family efflux transporter MFP subunit
MIFANTAAGQTQGFIEPYRTIALSSDESGAIAALNVEEGDRVRNNDVIATLDSRVQELQLEIAEHMEAATSQLAAAEHTYKKRMAISQQLEQLREKGHASESELIRADMELSIAKAKFLAAKEEQAVREIEKRRAAVQLERRNIRAPFDGVVSKIHRREGEFLSPLRPEIVTLIQTDQLLAAFAVPSSMVSTFQPGKQFDIEIVGGQKVVGTVHSIGVETDAQSGTVVVKFLIDNPAHEIRAGESCVLNI